ncbi:class I SAM-dependent methyltransferase [Trichothermofontia sp.]
MSAVTSAPASLTTALINAGLAIKPIAQLAKHQARSMMVKRAEQIGVPWRQHVQNLQALGDETWTAALAAVQNPNLTYPDYYLTSFHAYEEGNLGWKPAMEVEVAARAVHARIWPEAGAAGDSRLRQSYHQVLTAQLPTPPATIVDLGCGVGMSTLALQETYPDADLTGVDLSPYFLAIAHHQNQQHPRPITWVHAAAEATGLPAAAYDLVSACLVFHELPAQAAIAILQEAHRLVRPGGHLAIMDMNPRSETFASLPPYVFTLLKSTEPYLDEYFNLDLEAAIVAAGFQPPIITLNSPRHRTLIAQVKLDA